MTDLFWNADSFVPVVGFRKWDIPNPNNSKDTHLLKRRGTVWAPGEATVAECRNLSGRLQNEHESPQQLCGGENNFGAGCGLHAYHTPKSCLESSDVVATYGWVMGAVIGWGRVLFDDDFFRAQFSRIVAFVEPNSTDINLYARYPKIMIGDVPKKIHALSETYGVPVVALDEVEEYASRYGELFQGHTREEERLELEAREEHEQQREQERVERSKSVANRKRRRQSEREIKPAVTPGEPIREPVKKPVQVPEREKIPA